ncbi:precorrin-6y C5,15-methyltransferase (decarboxylating) subunit CbiE [Pararhodospirillum oryzae]|uniref:Precorrin-6Y C5,15-methyltransferase (Decarboxylating) n=1 Tax=Pararhodospirillum oryzae TaxID=478448 RepID=A0A512H6K2_9PROT|nr:precorrin-6y C5,15-methyltransferase (decarboxylating) subunit CbiE [Pararhodospirillum oryzae]GEO81105.1 precorrin-6Y C5,15-methyltransferase (decarboxylating) [Pararhodospirillum oryzae]
MAAWLTVVGIGEDGLAGLGEAARAAVDDAEVLIGGERHLALVPPRAGQTREAWTTPFTEALARVVERRGQKVCLLASGDPMYYGVGATLGRLLAADEMRVFPAPSSLSLAAARLGWALQDVVPVTVHGRPLALVQPHLVAGARLMVLSENATTPARLAALLAERGFGSSTLHVLEHLGGPRERCLSGPAAGWAHAPGADLNLVAVEVTPDSGPGRVAGPGWSTLAGLPDGAFHHDGQITKQAVRAVTLGLLGPRPRERLWDVGAGCGSIAVEWMRAHPTCRAVAIEDRADRRAHIAINREALGVPGLEIVEGRAPTALAGLAPPDAVFIGGGLTGDGVFETCWQALRPGGRLVANAVTLQTEALLVDLHARVGGSLTRLSVAHAAPLGGFLGWRTAMPVTLFAATKP